MRHLSKAVREISLRKFNYIIAGLSLLLSFAFLFAIHQIVVKYDELRTVMRNYNELGVSSRELLTASDYLTEQVRLFTVTGERVYLDNYFEEATVTRRREKALDSLRSAEGTTEAYRDLVRAMDESVALMQMEYLAMRLTIEARGFDVSEYPRAVRDVVVPEEYAGLSGEELKSAASMLVLNEEYCGRKNAAAESMGQCVSDLIALTETWRGGVEAEMGMLIRQLRLMILVTISFVFLRILFSSLYVVSPLMGAEEFIRGGQTLPVRGVFELRFLARTYNRMLQENSAYTERLAFEANHDKVTGAYNRSGYEELLESVDMGSAALLLIDVDKFKSINDTYGHKTGDLALAAVSKALEESFRSGDYVCRIGGDEFAVIMKNTGPERKELIASKIERINERLRRAEGGAPAISLSVGCAFGNAGGSGTLDRDADAALYRVKENGRCGCAFYEE